MAEAGGQGVPSLSPGTPFATGNTAAGDAQHNLTAGNLDAQDQPSASDLSPDARNRDPTTLSLSDQSHFSTGLSVDEDSDADSALGDVEAQQSSQSVRASIYEFVEEHGRTFHRYKQGRYWLPNDEMEQERLDLQHAVFTIRLGNQLGLAPLNSPRSVLDIGTGTGIWAIEYAVEHPAAQVLGTDLSPIQPEYVPPNCRFEIDDAEDEWLFSETFDYVHLRMMFHCFRDHVGVMRSALAQMRPGGYMEWQDWLCVLQSSDDSIRGTPLERWSRLYVEAGNRLGRNMLAPRRYKHWMAEAGFVDIVETRLAVPGNPWAKGRDNKRMGFLQMTNFLDGLHAATMKLFTKGLGWTSEAVELFLVDMRKAIKDPSIHFYWTTYVVYGRKP
ncbi:S-adenosyl-L-methionine-dependent methyltransferase [Lasiosphaeris hirsuta]|uniref:S-adenosyl-L-methionine-dependent methyltransferase n=1 Tax=Lasiosphaeris hirsuta TaxID=260670 RepID=A0AA40AY51_9PEZI|nr:S-adenosyl-L-methionine-dependent methyltransferase [Lasiosphaeris hirsuta]